MDENGRGSQEPPPEEEHGSLPEDGQNFGELIDYFIVGGDETNMQADADGSLKILGQVGVKKHEKKAADYRGSCTMYRTGNCAGNNGPTAFIMAGEGEEPKMGYDESFLLANGCASGSCIAMTSRAFMTDKAWVEITPR